jgi:hypothetical protein
MNVIRQSALIESEVHMSECGKYRFSLKRKWSNEKPMGAFLCKNPSKAGLICSDNTMSNCTNLAFQWGWGGFFILNLYPIYSTNPNNIVPDNKSDNKNIETISEVIKGLDIIVLACGTGNNARLKLVINSSHENKLFCIKKNADGSFLHPSRIKTEDYSNPIKVTMK